MSAFQSSLDAFFQGKLSLHDLEQALDGTVPGGRDDNAAALDKAFASGRLPAQIYHSLKGRLHPEDAAGRDQVHPAVAKPESAAFDAQTERTVRGIREKTPVQLEMDNTRIVADATVRVPPPGLGQRSGNESLSKEARPTGSNWDRPEQWTETHADAIGPGSVIKDRFEIVEQLGKGGMGIVFKARDRRKIEAGDTDPYIAIKILSDEFRTHPQALVALQREATKAQSLAHPNIVTVYDFDRDGTTVYMTMELLRGQSLSDFARKFRRGAPPKEAVPVIEGMAEGLAYAHKRNIVHSDFKPGNVFLGDDGRVKILDFGIARATQAGGAKTGKTVDFDAGDLGAMTPGYASLEMFNGEPPDPADDIYALAVTAYQLLSGDHPYGRRTAAEAIVAKKQPRPIAGISRRQWKTISQSLALRREDRVSDASQFLRRFRGPSRAARISSAVIAILTLSLAYFAWVSVQDPGPDVPFGELPAQVQAEFSERIAATRAMPAAFANQAIELYIEAWDLHPRNPIAQDSMDAAVRQYVEQILQDLERLRGDRQGTEWRLAVSDALENVDRWQENEYLAKSRDLDGLRSALEEMRKQD